jgi:hypothetical protein
MADRTEWDAATRRQRQLAVAADAEVRRRHSGQYYAPLRSAEPAPATGAQRAELTLTAGDCHSSPTVTNVTHHAVPVSLAAIGSPSWSLIARGRHVRIQDDVAHRPGQARSA